jgi:hypothetical protein
MIQRNYKTAKGTELPLLNLRGREYLEVKYRLVWFREDHPDWSIETELMSVTDVSAYGRATIRDEKGRIIATSHKFESIQGFPDFIEKAETGAIGRALALIGYGTQFCADELDEGGRIVDAPVNRGGNQGKPNRGYEKFEKPQAALAAASAAKAQPKYEAKAALNDDQGSEQDSEQDDGDMGSAEAPADYMISFGRKYKGRKLKEIPKSEMEGYIKWLESSAVQPGTPLSHQVDGLKKAFDRLYNPETVPAH